MYNNYMSNVIDDDEGVNVYFSKEVFDMKDEMSSLKLSLWTSTKLADFIRHCDGPNRRSKKYKAMYAGFGKALDEYGMDGKLLQAGT